MTTVSGKVVKNNSSSITTEIVQDTVEEKPSQWNNNLYILIKILCSYTDLCYQIMLIVKFGIITECI